MYSIYDILAEAKFYLKDAFEDTVTNYLLKSYIKDHISGTYFCDFLGLIEIEINSKLIKLFAFNLGQNDVDEFFRPKNNQEDCLFRFFFLKYRLIF